MTNPKELIYEEEARESLRKGIHELSSVVSVTLGPKGRNVGLQASWGAPTITNDGNTIVKEIALKNQYENMGVSLGKEVAAKMKEKCGDGTTSSIILLNALVQNGVKNIASGASPIGIKRGIDKAVDAILKEIDDVATQIKSDKEIRSIAIASASGNAAIGDMIADALKKAGASGVVTIEEGKSTETTIETVEGMQFDRGYVSPYFCTKMEQMIVEMTNPHILITDKKISSVQEILNLLQAVASTGQEMLIIAEDIEGDCLSTLVINKLRSTLKVCAVKAPGFGDQRKALLQDIALLTGATVVSEEAGILLKDATSAVFGSAEKVVITKEKTTLINGKGKHDAIASRIKQIDAELMRTTSSYDKEKLEARKAKLAGGVSVLRVGAGSEPEMKQKKQMFEDSLNSTKAAQEEGIVSGGGTALLFASKAIQKLSLEGDEAIGAELVIKACESPIKQIVMNTGYDPSLILEEVLAKGSPFGFNVATEKVENLIKAGILDPAKMVKNALKYAASTAGVVLLSEVLIGDAPEEEEEKE